jgi:class 3 adenylate cyclase
MPPPNDPVIPAGADPSKATTMSVLFADVAGSTKLYDTLGDTQAKQMIDECIDLMRSIVKRYGGRVVKTIGDEVMAVLPDADSGCLAATDMQTKITDLPGVGNVKRAIRVGFHTGAVIEQDNDVFGDTVNVAARMAGVARAQQIITTRATVDMLSPLLRKSSRKIAALSVKGKGDDVEVCEIIWQGEEELTTMATTIAPVGTGQSVLRLTYGASQLVLDKPNVSIVLGRDVACNVPISDRMASRHHARIERRRDKFYLVDQSTNGTYVVFAGEAEISLRREEVMLRGVGRIAFGRSCAQSDDDTVEFVLTA